jgi:hypothetical protein
VRAVAVGVGPEIARVVDAVGPAEARHPVREIRMQRAGVARIQSGVANSDGLAGARQAQNAPHVGNVHHVRPDGHVVPQLRLQIGVHPFHFAPGRDRFHRRNRQMHPHQRAIRQGFHADHRRPRQPGDLLRDGLQILGAVQPYVVFPRPSLALRQLLPHRFRPLVFRQEFADKGHFRHRPDRRDLFGRRQHHESVFRHVAADLRPRRLHRGLPLLADHVAELHQPRRRAARAQSLDRRRTRGCPEGLGSDLLLRAPRIQRPPIQNQRSPLPPRGNHTPPHQTEPKDFFHAILRCRTLPTHLHEINLPSGLMQLYTTNLRWFSGGPPLGEGGAESPILRNRWFSTVWKTFFHTVENFSRNHLSSCMEWNCNTGRPVFATKSTRPKPRAGEVGIRTGSGLFEQDADGPEPGGRGVAGHHHPGNAPADVVGQRCSQVVGIDQLVIPC